MPKILSALCVFLLIISGCQTLSTPSKGKVGSIIGGIGGAIAGNKLGKGGDSTFWTIAGAAAGAWAGYRIGEYLDEQDRKKMAEASQKAVISGETQTWNNPDAKTSGKAEVLGTRKETEELSVPVLKDRVGEVPPLDLIGEPFMVDNQANVRGGPGVDSKVVDKLEKGETVDVIGKVQGLPWFMVGKNQVGTGFVYETLLKPIPLAERIDPKPTGKFEQGDIRNETVAATRTCRTVHQVVTLADGTEREEDITACQGPNGWEIQLAAES